MAQDTLSRMVVEIPAGTNLKYEFNKESQQFEVENIDSRPRSIDFLPYPGNYGYIQKTLMDTGRGGDGDALDVLLIGEAIPQGTKVDIIPLGILKLIDHGEIDDKIVAIPADPDLRVIQCVTLDCIMEKYPAVLDILKLWFTNYKGAGNITFEGWENEQKAVEAINYWSIR